MILITGLYSHHSTCVYCIIV